ncbi:hypothetical protein BABINDRAFT_165913 [Babjeviella inositovora NRRL Y-12698]|uniref:Large ribosomal subunit protein mL59 domain-containing protein n=1 Tax=Babjeviella inositovora NRRL Y-12698 TaxID=984486 RepID=A0A1E3QW58_9ASCO|nr:uncharacterized protein BABINDRAFT_165913 [Babjeviella inositovora NRRL Y-12698]ODQ81217.1 hypothetical protein BABINDRAFT_165913 [Babjeviella inositovora NRRL Y-12698]
MSLTAKQAFEKLPSKLANFFQKYPPAPFRTYAAEQTSTDAENANPFFPNRHPVTNTVHDPKYSLRRAADLWKLAHKFGISDMLPPLQGDRKFYDEKYETKTLLRGAYVQKLRVHQRSKPARQAKVEAGLKAADDKIAASRGKKHYKRMEENAEKKKQLW